MKNFGEDLSRVVFKLADHVNLSEYKFDVEMLNVAWAMDGKRSLDVVAQEDHYELEPLLEKVGLLLEMGVIEVKENSHSIVDQEFVDFLSGQLSKRLGPVSNILIADAAKELGHSMTNFPVHKLRHLIHLLAQEIHGKEDKIAFKLMMGRMTEKKNY